MGYLVSIIFDQDVVNLWDKILPYINRVTPYTDGRITSAGVLDRILKREANCWITYDDQSLDVVGFMITRIVQYDTVKALSVEQLAGDFFDQWIERANSALIILAQHENCNLIECVGRAGWERKLKRLGWKTRFTTVQLMINERKDE